MPLKTYDEPAEPRASSNGHVYISGKPWNRTNGRVTVPKIKLNATKLNQTTEFLIDTGAEINIIHLQTLKLKTMIATLESMAITGITENSFNTLGSMEITYYSTAIRFQVIKHKLPLGVTGILGVDFLKTENAEISFDHNTLVTSSRPNKPIRFLNCKPKP